MVEDLKAAVEAAVETARASHRQAEADHERVKEVLIQARLQTANLPLEDRLGPKVLELLTDSYLDRATISRITSEALAAQEHKPGRKQRAAA